MSTRSSHNDPFPREQAVELVKRLPTYAKLALALGRDEALPGRHRAALIAAGTYVVSPIGLVPGFVPLLGQLDDLWILLRALRYALDGLSPQTRSRHLAAAGLTDAEMARDFSSVNDLVAWSGRRGRSVAVRTAAGGQQLGRRLANRANQVREAAAARRAGRSGADTD